VLEGIGYIEKTKNNVQWVGSNNNEEMDLEIKGYKKKLEQLA
jgi:hypothetical protein